MVCGLMLLPQQASARNPFKSQGMWIWYVSQTEKGNVKKIVAKAKKHKIKTLFIKSSDGANWWKQWDTYAPKLKEAGLEVCAWQYVYGSFPVVEATLAARAAQSADCIVVDAEVEYKNRYKQAAQYISSLREQIGPKYPVGFTSFAYPDFHPTIPYSVFLGPGGAQWNLPQMYHWTFPTTVAKVFAHTYEYNQIYQRPIHPLGQTYDRTPRKQAELFRRYVRRYKAAGYSWWSWTHTLRKTWPAMRARMPRAAVRRPKRPYPELRQGNKSDMVRWVKLKLNAVGGNVGTTLSYDKNMTAAVKRFQAANGLPTTGRVDAATWPVVQKIDLELPPPSEVPLAAGA